MTDEPLSYSIVFQNKPNKIFKPNNSTEYIHKPLKHKQTATHNYVKPNVTCTILCRLHNY